MFRAGVGVFAGAFVVLALCAVPAFAALEVPEVAVEDSTAVVGSPATEALLRGVLNPAGAGEAGTYRFLYKASKAKVCTGGAETTEGISPTGERQELAEPVAGLSPGTEYAVCLRVENNAKTKSATSLPVTFTTAIKPEKPETISPAKLITATTATLEGVLNPIKAGEAGSYEVLYRLSPSECEGEHSSPEPPGVMSGAAKQAVAVPVSALQPDVTYTFCLLARNKAGETAVGPAVHFTTKPAPPTIVSESVSNVKSSEATLEGVVNPNNQVSECHFQYGATTVSENEVPCSPELLKGYGEQSVGPKNGEGAPQPVDGLSAGTEYHYRIVAKNGKGEEATEEKTFKTAEEPEKQPASEVTATTATLNGALNPQHPFEAGTYEFTYEQSETECIGAEETNSQGQPDGQFPYKTAPDPAEASAGNSPEPEHADITGLQPGAVYTFCLLERNAAGEEAAIGSPETFATLAAAPAISAEQVTNISETTATLGAEINPDGAETAYHFEYDTVPYETSAPQGTSTAQATIPPGTKAVSVEAQLKGLAPDTTYYYRAVATSSQAPGGVQGPDKTLTTPAAASSAPETCPNAQRRVEQPFGLELPDCRAYEQVSPTDTNGQDATDSELSSLSRASVSGEDPAITYASSGSFASPTGATTQNQFLSRRGPGGWSTQSITPLHDPSQAEAFPSYLAMAFTPELTEGIANTNASLTGEAPTGLYELGLYVDNFASGAYQYVSKGQEYVLAPSGASTDLTHVVFDEEARASEWVNGEVIPVGVANDGEAMGASVGTQYYTYARSNEVWHAVSNDGSRVYFTSPANAKAGLGAVYVRVNAEHEQSKMKDLGLPGEECLEPAEACTIQVSPGAARYWGASANGEKVFYTEGEDLYEYSLPLGQVTGGQTTALTEGGKVQGVVQISEEGQYVYFVAKGALTGAHGEPLRNGQGQEPVAEEDNLYASHEGAIAFIATLAVDDESDWARGSYEGEAGPATHTSVASPSGEHLAFMSERSLTGYDNHDANTGEPDDEVYLYDAQTGGLVCASCDPSGARPVGPSNLNPHSLEAFSEYRPRNLLEDGTLFFDSSDALVAHASDGRENVYEYEDGRVYAISDVAGAQPSFFLDADASGVDVLFATANDLLAQVTGEDVVVYDARVDGGFPVPASVSACSSGDSCEPAPTPQPGVFGASGSATFSGPGDLAPAATAPARPGKTAGQLKAERLAKALKACRKKKARKKRAACERSARKKYGVAKATKARKAEKTSDEREAGR
jgi:hypothetical protein